MHLLRSEQRLVSGEVEHGGGRVGWVKERTPSYEGGGEVELEILVIYCRRKQKSLEQG